MTMLIKLYVEDPADMFEREIIFITDKDMRYLRFTDENVIYDISEDFLKYSSPIIALNSRGKGYYHIIESVIEEYTDGNIEYSWEDTFHGTHFYYCTQLAIDFLENGISC